MSDPLVLDVPVLLPDALDGRDQCVTRLTATLDRRHVAVLMNPLYALR